MNEVDSGDLKAKLLLQAFRESCDMYGPTADYTDSRLKEMLDYLSTMKSNDPLLTVAEASELMKMPASKIYTKVYNGTLPHERVGSKILVRRSAVLALVAADKAERNNKSISVINLARAMKISPEVLYKLIRQGKLPAEKVGCKYMIKPQHVKNMLSSIR